MPCNLAKKKKNQTVEVFIIKALECNLKQKEILSVVVSALHCIVF
jgi:hypothetical protein